MNVKVALFALLAAAVPAAAQQPAPADQQGTAADAQAPHTTPPPVTTPEALENTQAAPKDIVQKALAIAGDICIYTNQQISIEALE